MDAIMSKTIIFEKGNYVFIPSGVKTYSAGVAAQPGYEICRVVFSEELPLKEGFELIRAVLEAEERPLTALCACELRWPEPSSNSDFDDFNDAYTALLSDWGLSKGAHNPVARTNVSPVLDAPVEPSVYGFSYTVESDMEYDTFVLTGSCEHNDDGGEQQGGIVAAGDVSEAGLLKKAQCVLGTLEKRLETLEFAWEDCTATQVYTRHNIYPFLASELARRGAIRKGLTWNYARPPVLELEFEMDCRRIMNERILVVDE